jgi:hypothetical protein
VPRLRQRTGKAVIAQERRNPDGPRPTPGLWWIAGELTRCAVATPGDSTKSSI